jgi:hypothetical protein
MPDAKSRAIEEVVELFHHARFHPELSPVFHSPLVQRRVRELEKALVDYKIAIKDPHPNGFRVAVAAGATAANPAVLLLILIGAAIIVYGAANAGKMVQQLNAALHALAEAVEQILQSISTNDIKHELLGWIATVQAKVDAGGQDPGKCQDLVRRFRELATQVKTWLAKPSMFFDYKSNRQKFIEIVLRLDDVVKALYQCMGWGPPPTVPPNFPKYRP